MPGQRKTSFLGCSSIPRRRKSCYPLWPGHRALQGRGGQPRLTKQPRADLPPDALPAEPAVTVPFAGLWPHQCSDRDGGHAGVSQPPGQGHSRELAGLRPPWLKVESQMPGHRQFWTSVTFNKPATCFQQAGKGEKALAEEGISLEDLQVSVGLREGGRVSWGFWKRQHDCVKPKWWAPQWDCPTSNHSSLCNLGLVTQPLST